MGFRQRQVSRLIGDTQARTNLRSVLALLGNPDAPNRSIYDNLGDFRARANGTSLLDALGIPDTPGKDLFTELATDRLDAAGFGLSAIQNSLTTAIPASPAADSVHQRIQAIDVLVEAGGAGDLAGIKTTVESNNTALNHGTYGLPALDSDLASIMGAIMAVQNNTRVTVALPTHLQRPQAGSTAYEITVNLYDDAGNMEDPDGDIAVEVRSPVATEFMGDFYDDANGTTPATVTVEGGLAGDKLVRLSAGRFRTFYLVPNTHAEVPLTFHFNFNEAGVVRHQDRGSLVSDATNDLNVIVNRLGAGLDAETAASKLDVIRNRIGDPGGGSIVANLGAISSDIGQASLRANLSSLEAMLGNPDAAGKSIWADLGDFVGMANFSSLKDALGLPDVAGKDLYTVLVSDRLDHATHGLASIRTAVDATNTAIGTPSDAAGMASTLHAALQAIFDAVDTLESERATRKATFSQSLAPGGAVGHKLDATDPTVFSTAATPATAITYGQMFSAEITAPDTGTKTVKRCLVDLAWDTQVTGGGGPVTGTSKWAVDGGGAAAFANAVDLTTEFGATATQAVHHASGEIVLADMQTLPFTLYLAGKVDNVLDSLGANVRSDAEITVTYEIA